MVMYRVYNENYRNFSDLSSVDFVEVDNTDTNCNSIYDPAVKNKLNIVNVKAADVANFIRTNKVLNNKWNQSNCTFMQPYQYEQQKIKDEIRDAEEQNTFDKLHGEDNMSGCNSEFMSMLSFDNFIENARNTKQKDFYEPTSFDSTPFDFNIDVDSIFKSKPKKIDEATDVTNLDSINIENSFLMQGSCLDMFNKTVEKIGDAKIREPEHTIPAKLEKQRRIEEYHTRHNRKKNQ